MKKIDAVMINPKLRLIHHRTEFPNGDKVETYQTKDLGTFVKLTTHKPDGKKQVQIHQLPNDVYDKSKKFAKLFMMCDEDS